MVLGTGQIKKKKKNWVKGCWYKKKQQKGKVNSNTKSEIV